MKSSQQPLPGLRRKLRELERVPGARAAAEWLLDAHQLKGPVLQRELEQLILDRPGPLGWHADAKVLKARVEQRTRLARRPSRKIGAILCGLGELAAHSNGSIEHPLVIERHVVHWLWRFRHSINIQTLMRSAAGAKALRPRILSDREKQMRAQGAGIATHAFAHEELDQELWRFAGGMQDHRLGFYSSGRYGVKFAARVALALDPQGLMRWARKSADESAKWAVLETLEDTITWSNDRLEQTGLSLMRANDPLCTMLGARLLINPPFHYPAPQLADTWTKLVEARVSKEDACWLCSSGIAAVDQRVRELRARLEQTQARRNNLGPPDPQKPLLNEEIQRVETDLERTKKHLAAAEMSSASWRQDTADMLRQSTISHEKWTLIFRELPRSLEERQSLADTIGSGASRKKILNENIDAIKELLGFDDLKAAFAEYLAVDHAKFEETARWAARAIIALADDNNKNIGQQGARVIVDFVKAAEDLLAEPHLMTRQFTRWQSALSRYACAVCFAFAVAEEASDNRRPEVARLAKTALEHAKKVLEQAPEPFGGNAWWFQQLSHSAVRWMQLLSTPQQVEAWGTNPHLPSYTRAIALWSAPAIAQKHTALALEQFERACSRWAGEATGPEGIGRAVGVLDIAIACSGKNAVADALESVWQRVSSTWAAMSDRDWSPLAQRLIAALREDGPDRTEILADPVFKRSC